MKFGEVIYYCKKKNTNDDYIEYEEPIAITLRPKYMSIQPINKGEFSIQTYGEDIDANWVGIVSNRNLMNLFKEGDLLYLDGENPNGELETGEKANGIIKAVRDFNVTQRLIIKKRL